MSIIGNIKWIFKKILKTFPSIPKWIFKKDPLTVKKRRGWTFTRKKNKTKWAEERLWWAFSDPPVTDSSPTVLYEKQPCFKTAWDGDWQLDQVTGGYRAHESARGMRPVGRVPPAGQNTRQYYHWETPAIQMLDCKRLEQCSERSKKRQLVVS